MNSRSPTPRRHRRRHDSRSPSRRHHCHRRRDRSSDRSRRSRDLFDSLRSRRDERRSRRKRRKRRRGGGGGEGTSSGSSFSGSLSDEIGKLVRREKLSKRREAASVNSSTSIAASANSASPTDRGSLFGENVLEQEAPTIRNVSPVASLDDELVRKRVEELVKLRLASVEADIERRVAAARAELGVLTRAQISSELQDEIRNCQRRELESKQRCEELEQQLKNKMEEVEELKQKLNEERLQMLKAKQELEQERLALRQEKEKFVKQEQAVILGKSGARPKLKFSLGGAK